MEKMGKGKEEGKRGKRKGKWRRMYEKEGRRESTSRK